MTVFRNFVSSSLTPGPPPRRYSHGDITAGGWTRAHGVQGTGQAKDTHLETLQVRTARKASGWRRLLVERVAASPTLWVCILESFPLGQPHGHFHHPLLRKLRNVLLWGSGFFSASTSLEKSPGIILGTHTGDLVFCMWKPEKSRRWVKGQS